MTRRALMAQARRKLGWQPKVKFGELVRMMLEYDLEDVKKHGDQHGHNRRS